MEKRGRQFINKYGFSLLLFAALLLLFFILGRGGPVEFDDSGSYMLISWHEGVMPVYPVLLLFNEWIFGKAGYLQAVIIEQAVLAAFSVTVLIETLRMRFGLRPVEGILLSLFALYPYTIEMPTVMTQAILTEGIVYSLFYLFLAVLLAAVWNKNYIRLLGAFCMTLLLAGVRSQLQILFGVCGVVFFYLVCMKDRESGGRSILRFLVGLSGCAVISLAGILLVLGLTGRYRAVLQSDHPFKMFAMELQQPEVYQQALESERQQQEAAEAAEREAEAAVTEETGNVEEPAALETEVAARLVEKNFSTSQYLTLVFSRGMYEADVEDAALFQDPVLQGLYLDLYEAVDAEKQRYVYAESGLWMWKDIVGGIGQIGKTCFLVPSEYYVAHAPEIIASDAFSDIRASHLRTIGLTLIRAHFGRFLYHTLMLLPQAFVSTVFFQFAPLYGFCHLVTALLYLSAFALMIWGYADARASKEGAEMMALVLGTNVVTVLVISLVFFGQQRYLVYDFGVFYMAFYLLLRQLWQVRLRALFRQKFLTGK